MYTSKAIQLAVEGGCIIRQPADNRHNDYFMSPDFWSSLGKKLGWEESEGIYCTICRRKDDELKNCPCIGLVYSKLNWKEVWHRFIDHLAEGKTAEDYFKSLLSK